MQSGDDKERRVDESIEESFPASDPPSTWAGADAGKEHDDSGVEPDTDRVEEGFVDDDYDHEVADEVERPHTSPH